MREIVERLAMKWAALVLCLTVGTAAGALDRQGPATTCTYHYGDVRSINLALVITRISQERDRATRIETQGLIAGKSVNLVLRIPDHWSVDPQIPNYRRATVVFSAVDGGGTELDALLAQHFGKGLPSVFTTAGFDAATRGSVEQIASRPMEFGGFANEEPTGDDDSRFLQCLTFVDVPNRLMRVAFLIEGYGGSPPKKVFEWLQTGADQSPLPTPVSGTPAASAPVAPPSRAGDR